MKSLQQSLQSRISLRRNMIRELEADVTYLKDIGQHLDVWQSLRSTKEDIKLLAHEQVTDKKLYAMLLDAAELRCQARSVVDMNNKLYFQLVDAGIDPVL